MGANLRMSLISRGPDATRSHWPVALRTTSLGPYRAFIIASNAVVQLRENGHSSFAQHARLAEVRVADEV